MPLECVFVYMRVCVGGLSGVSARNMSLVLAVTLEPQTSVPMYVSDGEVRGGC